MGDSCLKDRKVLFELICQESLNKISDSENEKALVDILKKSIYNTNFDSSQIIKE